MQCRGTETFFVLLPRRIFGYACCSQASVLRIRGHCPSVGFCDATHEMVLAPSLETESVLIKVGMHQPGTDPEEK
jgi:hypothetical protein